jgi:SAM-dependent methyltransferase
MSNQEQWDERYLNGDAPWDAGFPDRWLTRTLARYPVPLREVLELGCGSGTNAIWLAQQGATVTALDLSPVAIQRARAKAGEAGARITFLESGVDVFEAPEDSFDLVFDRGCFHCLGVDAQKAQCIESIHRWLRPDGHWLSMMGCADAPPREDGPPTLTATQITAMVEPYFEVHLLERGFFDSQQSVPAPAWICLLRKRVLGGENAQNAHG